MKQLIVLSLAALTQQSIPSEAPGSADPSGKVVSAPTMHQTSHFRHAETSRASVLELPYENSTMALVVVLPHRGQGLAEVVENEDIGAWTRALSAPRVRVALPSFRIALGRDWTPALRELGISRAFDPEQAELSLVSPDPYYVDAVLQNACITVDERGTEAAAVTAIDTAVGAALEASEALEFEVDRPFLFFIRNAATGAVLFVGQVEDPTA